MNRSFAALVFGALGMAVFSYACESEDSGIAAGFDAGPAGSFDAGEPSVDGGGGGTDAATPEGDGAPGGDAASSDAGGDADVPDATPLACADGLGDCDGDPSNGCEATLANNAEHCGACGRNCAAAGATCQTDKCSAIELHKNLPISTDNSNARSFAFGNGAIYHATYGGYAVRRIPLDGSATSVVWSTTGKAAGIESLVLTDSEVVWAERGSPDVVYHKAFTAAADALPQVRFTPETEPSFVRRAGPKFYWASGDYQSSEGAGYIYSRDVTAPETDPGTKIVTIDQGKHGSIVALEPSSDALYWVTSDASNGFAAYEIRMTPLAGGTPVAVPGGAITGYPYTNRTQHLRSVGNTLYFIRNVASSGLNGIYKFTPGDAKPTQLVSAEDVTGFIVAGSDIYYSTNAQSPVLRAPISGGKGVPIASSGGGILVGTDAKFVYTVSASASGASAYKIVR